MTQHPRHSWAIYGGAAVVFILSFSATWFLPVPDLFRGLASIPGIAALIGVILQLWREQRLHERSVELLYRQQDFALATASHMAEVAYDKHVAFCEVYIARTNKGIGDLFGTGPSGEALTFAIDLRQIRIDHATWLSSEIEEKLIGFESALRKMGAGAQLLNRLQPGERLSRVVDQIYNSFGIVTGTGPPGSDEEAEIVAARIIDHLRDVLDVKELTKLRQHSTRLALRRVSQDEPAP